VANTIADLSVTEPLQAQPIDPPTLSMRFAVNDSRWRAAKAQGDEPHDPRPPDARSRIECRHPRHRAPTRTASKSPGAANCSLGVLIETMRREGFELGISRPRVLFQTRAASWHRAL
jgi:GTP-binding protein